MGILNRIPPKYREKILYFRGIIKNGNKKSNINDLSNCEINEMYTNKADKLIWKKAFASLSIFTDKRGIELAKEFYGSNIKVVNENQDPSVQSVVLICVTKNECENLKKIYEHYTKLGINSFVLIDNDSNDGTLDYFSKIDNVNIYSVKDTYTSIRRQAWINKVMSRYGFNKWYIVVDSDEYLAYNNCEEHDIRDVIQFCENNKIHRMQALMVDMYPKKIIFDNKDIDFLKEFCYFDFNTYSLSQGRESLLLNCYQGGIRSRLFSNGKDDSKPWLTKYPLLFLEPGDIQYQSHMSFPFYKNFESKNYLVLRHYKFLPTDLEKYQERVRLGNFAGGSEEYKKYVEKMSKGYINFYSEDSSENFTSSESFYKIPVIERIPWKKR